MGLSRFHALCNTYHSCILYSNAIQVKYVQIRPVESDHHDVTRNTMYVEDRQSIKCSHQHCNPVVLAEEGISCSSTVNIRVGNARIARNSFPEDFEREHCKNTL